jgi:hypothetical protein
VTSRVRFVLSLVVSVASTMLLASAAQAQSGPPCGQNFSNPNVTTWHNDNCRTGWQTDETVLTATGSGGISGNFGLLWQWTLPNSGLYKAQPLAVANVAAPNCSGCDLVFVADLINYVYAFNAASNSNTPVWSTQLGTPVTCSQVITTFPPCELPDNPTYVGIIGTPVIDFSDTPSHLYAVAADSTETGVEYWLYALDITDGSILGATQITASVTVRNPGSASICTNSSGPPNLGFDSGHIQRSALLLMPNDWIYVAFAPADSEWENGWLFAYSFNGTQFTQQAVMATTPDGTGGGIWGAGAGPSGERRSDGTSYIYAVTGNGTFDYNSGVAGPDYGDSLLKLSPTSVSILDYYTPSDVFDYAEPNPPVGLCPNDVDLGSGGSMIFPDNFYQEPGGSIPNLIVNADKQSQLYVANRDNLGQFVASGGNNVEVLQTPTPKLNHGQGYWSSPSYWKFQVSGGYQYNLYYAATAQNNPNSGATPYPIYQYILNQSGSKPITANTPGTDYNITTDTFCQWSPTTSVSSNGTQPGTGIVWAIENGYQRPATCQGNQLPAVLHAFNAADMATLYTSAGVNIGDAEEFTTPTVFKGRVYIGTHSEIAVFGLN